MKLRDARPDDFLAIIAIYNAAIPGRLATADLNPVLPESRRAWFGRRAQCWAGDPAFKARILEHAP